VNNQVERLLKPKHKKPCILSTTLQAGMFKSRYWKIHWFCSSGTKLENAKWIDIR